MTTATLPSGTGIVSTYTYDDADRLTNIAHVKGIDRRDWRAGTTSP